MEYSIVRVNKYNYLMHDNMIFHRKHGGDKNDEELKWTNPNYGRNGIAHALMMQADILYREKGKTF